MRNPVIDKPKPQQRLQQRSAIGFGQPTKIKFQAKIHQNKILYWPIQFFNISGIKK